MVSMGAPKGPRYWAWEFPIALVIVFGKAVGELRHSATMRDHRASPHGPARSGQRTREGLETKRAEGVRLGRPPVIDPQLVERIRAMRDAGMTLG